MSSRPCDKCQLSEYANFTCIQGVGNIESKVVIVGDNPNFHEDRDGEYGKGNSQKLLDELTHSAGLKDYYYTPGVKCRKGDKKNVSASQFKECRPYLNEELEKIKPEYVITLGANALKAVTNKAGITDLHGGELKDKRGFTVLPTFHPAMSLRDPRFWESIHSDFKRFSKIISGEGLRKHKLVWKRIRKESGLGIVINHVKRSKLFSYDTETNGLQMRYRTSEIGITVVSVPSMNYVVEHEDISKKALDKFHKELSELSKKKDTYAQNGKFDNLWIYYRHGVGIELTFDTMLASHLLDENSPNGLKQNSMTHLDADGYDVPLWIKNGLGKRGKGLTRLEKTKRAKYAAWDGYFTLRLGMLFKDKLSNEPELEKLFYKMVMPIAKAYETIEKNGNYIDLEKMESVEKILTRKLKRIVKSLNRTTDSKINWNSTDQINKLLFDDIGLEPVGFTDGGAPSTAEDYLKKMVDDHECIPYLLEYRGVEKQLSTYINGWKRVMIDGKIYPTFKISGTVTGRPACGNPNLQAVPRDPMIRSLIGAPPGWIFFEADYSQIELRIAAAMANERTMLQTFRTGGDIHESTYREIMGISTEEAVAHIKDPGKKKAQLKEERKKAKAINFGFIYGMYEKKFMEYCESKMELIINLKQSKEWRKRYFDIYYDLLPWHEKQKKIVRALGEVRTYTGRKRRLPQINSPDRGLAMEAERQAINSPVQGFAGELMLMAVIEVNEYFGNNLVKLSGTIHDAMVGIVREDVALKCMARIKKIMESPRLLREFNIELPLPIIGDITLGNWGIGKEYSAEELPEPIILGEDYEEILP